MVVRLIAGRHLRGAVRYNEAKVNEGVARQLAAVGYGHERLAHTSEAYKTGLLEGLAARNPRVGKPCLHVALAFHPREPFDDSRLRAISDEFIRALGYGGQPYLLYRHHDTAHPHVHLITVSIDWDGRRISDSHLRWRAGRICRDLEQRHGLVPVPRRVAHEKRLTRRPARADPPPGSTATGAGSETLRLVRLATALIRQTGSEPAGSALKQQLIDQFGASPETAARIAGLLARQKAVRGMKRRASTREVKPATESTRPLPPAPGPAYPEKLRFHGHL